MRRRRAAIGTALGWTVWTVAGGASAQQAAAAEDAAPRAWLELKQDRDPAGAIAALADALVRAGLPRTAEVALAWVATQGPSGVRAQATGALQERARSGDPLALALLEGHVELESGASPDLAVRLARAHLEHGLALAPPEEGASFGAAADPSATAPQGTRVGALGPGERLQPPKAPAAREQIERARALAASVPESSPLSGSAHEVGGLAALAAADAAAAAREFSLLAAVRPGRDGAAAARRERALLQLARIAYGRGDDAAALALYGRVSRSSPEWLDALFESSWSHFRNGEDEKALGNLLTLHAPFFQGRFFPESFVLKALLLYENCRFEDARRTLTGFDRDYRPIQDALAQTLAQVATPALAAELLAEGPAGLAARVPAPAREAVAKLLLASALQGEGRAASELAAELDSFDRRSSAFRSSELSVALAPELRKARLAQMERTGSIVRARIGGLRAELRELLGQSLRLQYEIAGREKELALAGGEGTASSARRSSLPQVAEDEELWPFQGEYWRDELGSYQFTLGQRCRRVAPGVPGPQIPDQPAPNPGGQATDRSGSHGR